MSDDEVPGQGSGESSVEPVDEALDIDASTEVASQSRFRRLPTADLTPVRLAITVGVAFALVMAGLCSWLGYRAYEAHQQTQLRQLLLQVGRQGAVNLTTIDYEHADADVKRILDSATGQFYDEFSNRSGPFIEVLKRTQSKSVGTITQAGLESVSGQEGQVLAAVSVKTTNRGAADDQPRYWRMRLTVTKNGGDTKVSKVEFVP